MRSSGSDPDNRWLGDRADAKRRVLGMQYWTTEEFIDGRVRFQRLSDAKFFNGWVEDFRGTVLTVEAADEFSLLPSDKFAFQLYGRKRDAIFMGEALRASSGEATVGRSKGHLYRFRITGDMTFSKSAENARFLARGARATVEHQEQVQDALVLDYSASGLGMLCPKSLPREGVVAINMAIGGVEMQCVAQVRYSRPTEGGQFRTGFKILRFAASSQERWDRLVQQEGPMREAA
ncbi:MAG TPA: PilZ domain-containing protein [Fimbriimonadaceae bacterium]|nr:PilZ domain-containing protein [Fimbriimonadaceae bacterium]